MGKLLFLKLPEVLKRLPLGEEKNIGIYGLGEHTRNLLRSYQAAVGPIKAKLVFIDSRRQTFSEKFENCDVYNVRDIGELPLDTIILSSSLFENEMYQMLQELYGDHFHIYRFYEMGQRDIFDEGGQYIIPFVDTRRVLKVKFVDFWSDFDPIHNDIAAALWPQYRLELSDEPEVLFCSHFGESHKGFRDCMKIFLMTEVYPVDFRDYDYVIGFRYMDDDKFFHYSHYSPNNIELLQDRRAFTDPLLAKRTFCNFVYSNESTGEGAVLRKRFCMELAKYKHIDCPGKVLNNMKDAITPRLDRNWSRGKVKFIAQYKFTIAFENHMVEGYTTEKLYDSFRAGSIPIYWGNPLIEREIESDAFINCNDFDNDFDAVIERIKEIDADDERYMYMLGKSPFKDTYDSGFEKMRAYLYMIIERFER